MDTPGDDIDLITNEEVVQNEIIDVSYPGVQPEMIIEEVPIDDGVKITRLGKAYSMKLVGECTQMALVSKRISIDKAVKLHKEKAVQSKMAELGTFHPIEPNTLSRSELKRMIHSFMFLTEKYNS